MSSSEWRVWRIGDIGKIVTGKTPPTQNENNFGTKFPFITPRDMLGHKQIRGTERYLSDDGLNTVKTCVLPKNAICVSCIGSDMGKVVMTTEISVTNQQLNSIICSEAFFPDFVYYAVIDISEEIKNIGHSSTAIPILNKTDFSNFEICAPEITTQRRIAEILSALDEKIELNRQTNATLEAMAQAIFDEWFVRFNFPGDDGERVESELGPIPRGWRVGKLGDLLSIEIGGDWGADNSFKGSVPVISLRGTDIDKLKTIGYAIDAPVRWVKESSLEKRLITPKDIVIGGSGLGPIGKSVCCPENLRNLYQFPIIYSNFCKRLQAESPSIAVFAEKYIEKIYFIGEMRQFFTGTSIPNLDIKGLLGYKVIIPNFDLIEKYNDVIGKEKNDFLFSGENNNLAQIRDALLPKLMNGEIEV